MSPTRPSRAHWLLVDDDPDDIHLLTAAIADLDLPTDVTAATNGNEALHLLATDPLPELVVLDLKMPGMSGFEVLDAIRHDPRLSSLTVIILSGSERESDRAESLRRGADAYLVKPTGLEALSQLARTLERRAHLARPAGPPPKAP